MTRAVLLIVGLSDALAGLALLVAPRWFFDTIGNIPPYSRHFMGDTGSFLLPVGVALILAARDPRRFRLLVWLGAGASLLHFLNHLYGSLAAGEAWLPTLEVAVPAVAMLAVAALGQRRPSIL